MPRKRSKRRSPCKHGVSGYTRKNGRRISTYIRGKGRGKRKYVPVSIIDQSKAFISSINQERIDIKFNEVVFNELHRKLVSSPAFMLKADQKMGDDEWATKEADKILNEIKPKFEEEHGKVSYEAYTNTRNELIEEI